MSLQDRDFLSFNTEQFNVGILRILADVIEYFLSFSLLVFSLSFFSAITKNRMGNRNQRFEAGENV